MVFISDAQRRAVFAKGEYLPQDFTHYLRDNRPVALKRALTVEEVAQLNENADMIEHMLNFGVVPAEYAKKFHLNK